MIYNTLINNAYTGDIVFNLNDWIFGEGGGEDIFRLLCFLAKGKDVFEFGTFRGKMTHEISKYANKIVTLDIDCSYYQTEHGSSHYVLGEIYKKYKNDNITQLIGDSLKFDFTPYYGKFDLIFIDGNHDYKFVKNDFLNSVKLLKPDGGWIIMDDPGWDGVSKATQELIEEGYNIKNLSDINYFKI